MATRDEIVRAIEDAFSGVRMPATEPELAPRSIESPYVYKHFLGKTRHDVITQTFLASLYMEDFSYMTEDAVRYYLPPVLRLMLATPDGELWIFLHGFLAREAPGFAEHERAAIAGWATFLAEAWEDDSWMSGFAGEAAELARALTRAR